MKMKQLATGAWLHDSNTYRSNKENLHGIGHLETVKIAWIEEVE
jgi:hypothetical protein